MQMSRTFLGKLGEAPFDHARIAAQATRRQDVGTHIAQQAFRQGATLVGHDLGELTDAVLNNAEAVCETQAIGVHWLVKQGGLMHEKAAP